MVAGEKMQRLSEPTLEEYRRLYQEYIDFVQACRFDPLAYACEAAFVVFLRDFEGLRLFLAIAKAIECETSPEEESEKEGE